MRAEKEALREERVGLGGGQPRRQAVVEPMMGKPCVKDGYKRPTIGHELIAVELVHPFLRFVK